MVPTGLIEQMKNDPLFGLSELEDTSVIFSDDGYVTLWFWSSMMTVFNNQAVQFYSEYFDMSNTSIQRCEDVYNYYLYLLHTGLVLDGEASFYHSVVMMDYLIGKSTTLYPSPYTISANTDICAFIRKYFPSFIVPILDAYEEKYTEVIPFSACFRSWILTLIDFGVTARYLGRSTEHSKLNIMTYKNNSYKLTKIQEQMIVNFISRRVTKYDKLDETDSCMLIAYINGEIYNLP